MRPYSLNLIHTFVCRWRLGSDTQRFINTFHQLELIVSKLIQRGVLGFFDVNLISISSFQ